MEKFNEFDMSIPKEEFEFANTDKISDQKFDSKPIGYFKDALIRFKKNKGSVVAFVIIVLIIFFALLVPFFVPSYQATKPDSYYKYMPARNVALKDTFGIMGGFREKDMSNNSLYMEYAKGVAADGWDGTIETVEESKGKKYQPVYAITSSREESNGTKFYSVKIDEYLSVGFVYKTVTEEECDSFVKWEEETGLHILYPLVDKYTADGREGKYTVDINDANYWFKMRKTGSKKGQPISIVNGKEKDLAYSDALVFEDNYYRVNDEIQYRYYNGSEDNTTYEVRILYYNYYRYLSNSEPNYIFGTDTLGLDLAYRLAKGLRLSLLLALVVSVINFVLGALYGAIEGYYGGTVDMVLERVSDILLGIPFVVVTTLFQMHLASKVGPVGSLIFAYILTGWIGTASRVRTQFYRFKNEEYVMAARTLGAKDRRIIWKHIFPNTLGTIITSVALVIPGVILSESSLSFLGIINLGSTSQTSLGTLLSDASGVWTNYPHLMFFPAMFISLLMICFNLFGNGLRDAFNPSLRGTEE